MLTIMSVVATNIYARQHARRDTDGRSDATAGDSRGLILEWVSQSHLAHLPCRICGPVVADRKVRLPFRAIGLAHSSRLDRGFRVSPGGWHPFYWKSAKRTGVDCH
jgi:hypothetical protein